MKTKLFKPIVFAILFTLVFSLATMFNNIGIHAFASGENVHTKTPVGEQSILIEQEEVPIEPNFVIVPPIDLDGFEPTSGFGCSTPYCGHGRENGYSSTYLTTGCRQWQQMPAFELYGWSQKYWIDESSLSPLNDTQKAEFIATVETAAAIWNSTRMHDGTGTIVNLQRVSGSGGFIVCNVEYNPELSSGSGLYTPSYRS